AELLERAGGPHAAGVRRAWDAAHARARDYGELIAAFLMAALPDWPFLVVDARRPELRAASTPVFDRYLERRARVTPALREGAAWLQARGHEVRIEERSGERSLFLVEGDLRRRWEFPEDPGAARAELARRAGQVCANVVLRPLAQDAVLPVLAQVVGPGEAAYFVQVRRVAAQLEARACTLFPRLTASLWPAEAEEVCASPPAAPAELLTGFDAQMRRHFLAAVPADTAGRLAEFEHCLTDRARELTQSTQALDPSLAQLVESARAKMDFQLHRLRDGILSKVRVGRERQRPRLARLKGFLLPYEKLQERTAGFAAPLLQWGPGGAARVLDLARRHVADTLAGAHAHYLERWDG
ncbi:MAG TPA: bacillithiol biosynthesis BshC, partial [Candidatus Saccharimonadales bacterium]|nr:bacillithiol biosynthesis BshC [Candidatus Saccharimonadales bacterium]